MCHKVPGSPEQPTPTSQVASFVWMNRDSTCLNICVLESKLSPINLTRKKPQFKIYFFNQSFKKKGKLHDANNFSPKFVIPPTFVFPYSSPKQYSKRSPSETSRGSEKVCSYPYSHPLRSQDIPFCFFNLQKIEKLHTSHNKTHSHSDLPKHPFRSCIEQFTLGCHE